MNITLLIIAISTTCLGYYLNFYKFAIMIVSKYYRNIPYQIFPWSANPKISKSDPIWLMIHLLISLILLTLSTYNVYDHNWYNKENYYNVFTIFHYLFIFLICINITNFSDKKPLTAIIINLVPMILLQIAYTSTWQYKNEIYFFVLASPVFIESIAKFKQQNNLRI
jgi:hypothetical protein